MYSQQFLSSCPHGQSMTPSQTCSADIHRLSPQCKLGLALKLLWFLTFNFFGLLPGTPAAMNVWTVVMSLLVLLTLIPHSPQSISSVWSAQSTCPSHFQSTGIHLVPSHWKSLVHTGNTWKLFVCQRECDGSLNNELIGDCL